MDGATADAHSRVQRLLVHSNSAKGRKQGRMDVDQFSLPFAGESIAMNSHEPRLANERYVCGAEGFVDLIVEGLAARIVAMREYDAGDARVASNREARCGLDVRDDKDDLCRIVRVARGGDQRSKVAAAAGNEDGRSSPRRHQSFSVPE